MKHQLWLVFCACVFLEGSARGETWNRFRGHAGRGIAPAEVPTRYSEWQHVRWKTPLPGRGWSSPVVDGGRRIWMTAGLNGGRSLRALCVDLDSAALIHNVEVFAPPVPEHIHRVNSHATPTPVTEAGRVYVSFGNQGNACLDAVTGEVIWRNQELRLDHKEGPGSSPILWGDLMILECDGIDVQYIAALDKATGRQVWRARRSAPLESLRADLRKAYGTPVVFEIGGAPHLVSCGSRRFYGYDPVDGTERWVVDHPGYNCAQTPLVAQGNLILGSGYNRARLVAIRLTPDLAGNVTDSHRVWMLERDVPRIPSPLVFGDRIFLIDDGGVASWVDAVTGKQLWRSKICGKVFASPITDGERIFVFDERGASVVLERAEPPVVMAVNQLEEGCIATPAVVENSLIVRTKTHLYRLQRR